MEPSHQETEASLSENNTDYYQITESSGSGI